MAGATARVYCANCGHDYLLAFSCKARSPLLRIPAPAVLVHPCTSLLSQLPSKAYAGLRRMGGRERPGPRPLPRQYVFALPRLLRPWFRHDRAHLGRLCQLVARLSCDRHGWRKCR